MNHLLSKILGKLNQQQIKAFRPVIISDIDGVLIRGKAAIPQTR